MRRLGFVACFTFCWTTFALAQEPLTRAERTNFLETSHFADVIAFMKDLQRRGAPIQLRYIGKSENGHAMPLVVAARPMVHSPAEARRSGKPIIYIQGNIHAGEVEGKEAAQMLLRSLMTEKGGKILDKVILLVNPIYNIDGNERFASQTTNRPGQNGPELVGTRASGQDFDLNRDATKAESHEMRSALKEIYNSWDPDVMMDLHTTNGTRHGYELTYSPPLHPNTDEAILAFTRDAMLPQLRKLLKRTWGMETFDYGDATTRNGKPAWTTFAEGARYVTNYVGLRNRIAILSEATSYIPFKDRVVATDRFVRAVIDYIANHADQVMNITRHADQRSAQKSTLRKGEWGVLFEMESRGAETTILEKPVERGQPRPRGRPVNLENHTMPIFDRFRVVKSAKVPSAYLFGPEEVAVAELLVRHGISLERLEEDWRGNVEEFSVSEAKLSAQPFQGHNLLTLQGITNPQRWTAPKGSFLVRMQQALAPLAFSILEPESSDGAATWGFLKTQPTTGSAFPIRKVFGEVKVPTAKVDANFFGG